MIVAAATSPLGHQAWISGEIWHRGMKKMTFQVDILVDTGAGGSSYICLALSNDSQMGQNGHLPQKKRAGCSTCSQSLLEQNTPRVNTGFHSPSPEVPVRNSGPNDNVPRSRRPPVRVDRRGRLP